MPPAENKARAPLPTPQWEISSVFTPMPIFSGHLKRTSGQRRLMPKIIYIATILAALALIGERQDTQAAGSFILSFCYMKKKSSTTLQLAASVWLRAAQER